MELAFKILFAGLNAACMAAVAYTIWLACQSGKPGADDEVW